MNNLRKFETLSDYQSAELVYPAVSLIAENGNVYFDPLVLPSANIITVTYYVDDPTNEVSLFNGGGSSSEGESGAGGVVALIVMALRFSQK